MPATAMCLISTLRGRDPAPWLRNIKSAGPANLNDSQKVVEQGFGDLLGVGTILKDAVLVRDGTIRQSLVP